MDANPTTRPLSVTGWSRLASPWAARVLALLMLLLSAAGVALAVLSQAQGSGLPLIPFAIVGYIVARRQPHNPLGWILLGLGLDFMLAYDAGQYAYMAYRQGYHLPFARAGVPGRVLDLADHPRAAPDRALPRRAPLESLALGRSRLPRSLRDPRPLVDLE